MSIGNTYRRKWLMEGIKPLHVAQDYAKKFVKEVKKLERFFRDKDVLNIEASKGVEEFLHSSNSYNIREQLCLSALTPIFFSMCLRENALGDNPKFPISSRDKVLSTMGNKHRNVIIDDIDDEDNYYDIRDDDDDDEEYELNRAIHTALYQFFSRESPLEYMETLLESNLKGSNHRLISHVRHCVASLQETISFRDLLKTQSLFGERHYHGHAL